MASSNPFSYFDLPVSPLIDSDLLTERFNAETARSHPDKFQNASPEEKCAAEARFMEINQAYQTLTDPKARLLALYELVAGKRPADVQRIPPGTMDLFVEVGQVCRSVDEFLQKWESVTGALAKAGLAREALDWQDKLQLLRGKLESWSALLSQDLGKLAEAWPTDFTTATPAQVSALETTYRKFSYLARWRQQLEEREVALFSVLM